MCAVALHFFTQLCPSFHVKIQTDFKIRNIRGLPGGLVVTNPPCCAVDAASIPGPGRPLTPESS